MDVTCRILIATLFLFLLPALLVADEAHPGAAIFLDNCADCHGSDGQGGDGFEHPLFGDESVHELSLLIERTMPEGDPESCVGEEAKQVAEYIYHDFYSPQARTEKGLATAPRLDLMRLTIPQYRNSVADLIARFTPPVAPTVSRKRTPSRGRDKNPPKEECEPLVLSDGDRGFHARYYESEGMTKTKVRLIERLDDQIAFDFGEGNPGNDIANDQFCVIWQGSVFARQTGYYEFKVRSPNGLRLHLNMDPGEGRGGLRDDASGHGQTALIDGWVNSSEMRELTARVFLLGGRQYPVRLEFFKYKEKMASIELQWKPPHSVWSSIDANDVVPTMAPRTFVTRTPFPADDRSLGYERGTSVSREWHSATNRAAIEVAEEVVSRLPLLAGFDSRKSGKSEGSADAQFEKAKSLVKDLAANAFKRPLSEAELRLYDDVFFLPGIDPEIAVKRAILFTLKSPFFLYPGLCGTLEEKSDDEHSDFATASRLALGIWDSIPDRALWKAASAGKLRTEEQIAAHAKRMIRDPSAKAKLNEFFHHWLELDERDLAKDRKRFPEFDDAVMADLRHSLELFVESVVWSESSDYRELLTSDKLLLNSRLKRLYALVPEEQAGKASDTESDEFKALDLSNQNRSGVLTHPYLLSAFAYHDQTSPIHRGVFLTKNIVGRGLSAPPEAVAFKDEEFDKDLTMREKVTQLTSSTTCMSCHSIINPLGFALENYDAVGRWRTTENEKPIDTVSEYVSRDGKKVDVRSAEDVAEFVISSPAAQRAFVAQLFHHVVKQDPLAYERGLLESLREQFVADEFSVQKLFAEIATQAAMSGLK